MFKFNYSKYKPQGLIFGEAYTWKEFSVSKVRFLNAPGLIHDGAYYRNFMVYSDGMESQRSVQMQVPEMK